MPGYPCKKCCSPTPPPDGCCLCDEAWQIESWSVSLFGKTLSGEFPTAPDPITPINCKSRESSDCAINDIEEIADCVAAGEWSAPDRITMLVPCPSPPANCSGIEFIDVKNFAATCAQCYCYIVTEGGPEDGICEARTSTIYETSTRGVDHWKAWQVEQFQASVQMICCAGSKVKFRVDGFYALHRVAAMQSAVFRRYRKVYVTCAWTFPTSGATPTFVYESWIEPAMPGTYPPCLPCLTADDEVEDCEVSISSDCGPPETVTQSITLAWEVIAINVGVPMQAEHDSCDLEMYAGSTDITVYSGSRGCRPTVAVIGPSGCEFGAGKRVIDASWESACYDCDAIPSTISLNRVGHLTEEDETIEVVADAECAGCGTIEGVQKSIPFTISLHVA